MAVSSINLIATKTDESTELTRFSDVLKKISYVSVLLLLVSGLVTGGVYIYMQSRLRDLTGQKNTLIQAIAADSAKEGLLLALRDRISVMDKLSAEQKHVDVFFNEVTQISSSGSIESVSYDDTNKAVLALQLNSIDQAIGIVDTLIKEAQAGKLAEPTLLRMTINKDGGFSLSLSFIQKV